MLQATWEHRSLTCHCPPHRTQRIAVHQLEPHKPLWFAFSLLSSAKPHFGFLTAALSVSGFLPTLSPYHPWLLCTEQKARTISFGSLSRYEMNSENLALSLLKLEESSKHMLLVKFGIFLKMCGSLSFRSTFFRCLAGCLGYSITFSFPALITSQHC